MAAWLGLLLGIPALLLAAKAHGRQVRLEREAAGYRAVEFGGRNPEFVERLWRRDRVRFWTFTPIASVTLGAGVWLATDEGARAALAALLWAPTAGFFFAGLWTYGARRGEGGPWWWLAAGSAAAAGVVASG